MAEVKILIAGYAQKIKDGWTASSTCCFIKSGNKKIITDPGCNRRRLLSALKKEKIKPTDINYVFLSHGHIDHILLASLFEKAKFITFDSNLLYVGDSMFEFDKQVLGKDIKVLKTPGHTKEHLSLLVKTSQGKIALAGDVFWWVDGKDQIINIYKKDDSHPRELDMKELVASRKKILRLADYIVPGHGQIFKVVK